MPTALSHKSKRSNGLDDSTLLLIILTLGFGCFLVFTHIFATPLDTVTSRESGGILSDSLISRNVSNLLGYLVIVILEVRFRKDLTQSLILVFAILAGISGVIAAIIESEIISAALCFIVGLANAVILVGFCVVLSNLAKNQIVLCVLGAYILSTVMVFLTSNSSTLVKDEIASVALILSGICLASAIKATRYLHFSEWTNRSVLKTIPWLYVGITWISFAGICILWGMMLYNGLRIFSKLYALIIVSFILFLLLIPQTINTKRNFFKGFVVMMSTLAMFCFAFLLFEGAEDVLAFSVLYSVKDCFIVLWVVCIVFLIREYQLPALFFGCVGLTLCDTFPYSMTGTLFAPAFEPIRIASLYILLIVCLIAIIASFIHNLKPAETIEEPAELPDNTSKPVISSTRFQQIAETYGLSERELDVLIPLSKGYSIQATAEKLFLSPNTVKAHLRNIENKVGVFSKQELIEFLANSKR